jgi:hypothetical protein
MTHFNFQEKGHDDGDEYDGNEAVEEPSEPN